MSGKPIDELLADYDAGKLNAQSFVQGVRAIQALTAAQQQGQAVACGGCGNADPEKVCIGCLHPFAAPQPMQQGGGEDNQCDGCCAGYGERNGIHVLPDGTAYMACQSGRYAPPSAPVGVVEALIELVDLMQGVIDGEYTPDSFTLQPARAALAQQPAAVDEAMVERAYQAWRKAAVAREGNKPAIRAALTTALTEARNVR